jgi:signal transduction histidine kinase
LLGTVTVAQFTQEHRLDLDDQVLVEELADRAALAIIGAEQFVELRAAKAAVDIERAKFESLVMRSPVPTMVYEGREHRLALMNDMATTLASAPALGLPILEAFPQVAGTPLLAALDEAFTSGERRTLPEHVTSVRTPDGEAEERVYATTIEPLRDAARHVIGVLVAASDVTEQVEAREEIEASLRFCEQLLGMLGHDLRNPLNAITVAATYLRFTAAESDTHGKDMVDRILDSASRMSTMVTQLLDLTRTRLVGGIALARRDTRLSAIVERALAELRLLYPGREIRLDVRSDAHGAWDADRLVQVFSNLVDNALAYGDATRPVSVRVIGDDALARVEVHNEGPAISPDLLPVLFEPYRRTGARKRESRGLGLGLYISQQIVRVHGGEVTVQSTTAMGTTFIVTLPL